MELHVLSDSIQFIRKNASMFFPNGEPKAVLCAQHLVAEVLALGGTDVAVLRDASWWAVGSNVEWFLADRTTREQFACLIPLPEVGPNASRVEVVIAAFAQDLATLGGPELEVLHGATPPEEFINRLRARALVRAVVFRIPDDAQGAET